MTVAELSSSDPLVNRIIEGYHFIKRIGEGTYGVVYMARHPRIKDRLVAVKYIKLEDPAEIRNVQREVQVLARLQHPNIVDIYDTYRFDRYQLIVMELVRGGTLLDALRKLPRPLDLRSVIYIVEQLAFALGYVHAQNVLHLDLKPANILLDPVADGKEARPLLTDFGIARMINPAGMSSSNIMGTPMYMSPEHFGFGDTRPDHRSDIYSLGIILYELVVGDYPFKSTEILDLLNQHAYSPVPLPSRLIPGLPDVLDAIIMRALAKQPDERFQSATEMGMALRELRLGGQLQRVQLSARMPAEALGAIARKNAEAMEELGSAAAPVEAPVFSLQVLYPDGSQEDVDFHTGVVIVGRDELADLTLDHPSVSRRHARIDCDTHGNLFVTDLGSTNGTFLDGIRLTPRERTPWKNTQILQIQGFLMQISAIPGGQQVVAPFIFTTEQVKVLFDELNRQQARPTVRVSLSPDIAYLEPGHQQYIQVHVSPEDTPPARYELRAKPGPEVDDRWFTLPGPQTIEAGDTYTFDLVVSAPETGTVGGKTYEIALEIASDTEGIPSVLKVLKIRVVPLTRFVVTLKPNEISHNRRRHAQLVVTNHGNYADTYTVDAETPDTLAITVRESQFELAPGEERAVALRFKPARGAQRGRSRLLFKLMVQSSSGLIERVHGGYVFQPRGRVPRWLWVLWLLLVVVAVLHFVLGISIQDVLTVLRSLLPLP
ncbi:MAG: hypothetical protein Kow0077_25640 [Anaerolineae bacterium]